MIDMPRLKKVCGDMLRDNKIDPNSREGRETMHIFWYAVMAQAQQNSIDIGKCLLSGRYEELVDMTGEIDNSEGT